MKKLVLFDMDDTLLDGNMWEPFNEYLGITPERDYELYKQYQSGKISYQTWTKLLEAEYKYIEDQTEIKKLLETYAIREGAAEAVTTAKRLGLKTAIVTGGFKETAQHLAEALEADYALGNTECTFLEVKTNVAQYSIRLQSGGEEESAKVRIATDLCNQLGVDIRDCIAVGDGANDIELFKATGCGVTFTFANKSTKQAARYQIDSLHGLGLVLDEVKHRP